MIPQHGPAVSDGSGQIVVTYGHVIAAAGQTANFTDAGGNGNSAEVCRISRDVRACRNDESAPTGTGRTRVCPAWRHSVAHGVRFWRTSLRCQHQHCQLVDSYQIPGPAARLPKAKAREVSLVCRRGETGEDQNVVQQFANRGATFFTPNVTTALSKASRDVGREAAAIRSADPSLAAGIADEEQILAKAGHLDHIGADQTALLTVLHRRSSGAKASGLPGCAGIHA